MYSMYSIRYHIDVPEAYLDELFDLFDGYVAELKEDHLTHENLCELANDLGVTIFFSGKKMVGFYLISKEVGLNRLEMAFVHHVFIVKEHRETDLLGLVEAHIVETAKAMGVMSVFYTTTRNADAFIRLLKGDWKIDSTVLKLDI